MHEHVLPEHDPKVARGTAPVRRQTPTLDLRGPEDDAARQRMSVALLWRSIAERAARQTEHGEALRGELSTMGWLVALYLLRLAVPSPSIVVPAPSPPVAPVPPPAAPLAALSGLGRPDDSAGIRRATDAGRTERPSTPADVLGRDGAGRAVPPPPTDLVPPPLTPTPAGLRRGASYTTDAVQGPGPLQRRMGT